MPITLITDIGEALIAQAAGDGSAVAISHVGVGDGLGALYAPSAIQTTMRREVARVAIERRIYQAPQNWLIKAVFPVGSTNATIREIGFFNAAGDLIAICAGLDFLPRQINAIDYILEHGLNLSRVAQGLIIVAAPDDELFDFALVSLAAQADHSFYIFNLKERSSQ